MPTITVDSRTTYQTWVGWEATAQAGQTDSPHFSTYKSYLFDQAINDLGIDRLRVEVVQSANGQPHFDLTELDSIINSTVIPMRNLSIARGESLWVNVCVVGNGHTSSGAPQYWANNPSSYAAAVLECYQHFQSSYGFLPDSWELALEPDNFQWGSGTQLGNALKAASDALTNAGFTNLYFVAPSHTAVYDVPFDFDQMVAVPGAATNLRELSFHGYGGYAPTDIAAIMTRANAHGLKTSQLEHIGDTHANLYNLLVTANISAYQQFTLAYPDTPSGGGGGGTYYFIDETQTTPATLVNLSAFSKYYRQYFRYIRRGAVRVAATSDSGSLQAVAFVNADGKRVVVVEASGGASFGIVGLHSGTYSIKYTVGTGTGSFDVSAADITIATGDTLSTSIPSAGVISIFSQTASLGTLPPPPPPAPVSPPPPIIIPPLPPGVVVTSLDPTIDAIQAVYANLGINAPSSYPAQVTSANLPLAVTFVGPTEIAKFGLTTYVTYVLLAEVVPGVNLDYTFQLGMTLLRQTRDAWRTTPRVNTFAIDMSSPPSSRGGFGSPHGLAAVIPFVGKTWYGFAYQIPVLEI